MKKYRFLLIGLFLLGMSSYVVAQDAYHKDFLEMLNTKNSLIHKMYELLGSESMKILGKGAMIGNPRRVGNTIVMTSDYELLTYVFDENQKISMVIYTMNIGNLYIPRGYLKQFYEEAKNNFLILLHDIGFEHVKDYETDDNNYFIGISLSREPVVRDRKTQELLNKKYQLARQKESQRQKEAEREKLRQEKLRQEKLRQEELARQEKLRQEELARQEKRRREVEIENLLPLIDEQKINEQIAIYRNNRITEKAQTINAEFPNPSKLAIDEEVDVLIHLDSSTMNVVRVGGQNLDYGLYVLSTRANELYCTLNGEDYYKLENDIFCTKKMRVSATIEKGLLGVKKKKGMFTYYGNFPAEVKDWCQKHIVGEVFQVIQYVCYFDGQKQYVVEPVTVPKETAKAIQKYPAKK